MSAYDPRYRGPMAHRPTGVRSGASPRGAGAPRVFETRPPAGGGHSPRRSGPVGRGPIILVAGLAVIVIVGAALVLGGRGGPAPSVSPSASGPAASEVAGGSGAPSPSPGVSSPAESPAAGSPTPSGTPGIATDVPFALVADVREPRVGLSVAAVRSALEAGSVAIPCGLTGLEIGGTAVTIPPATKCLAGTKIADRVRAKSGRLGLLPPGLVSARVKVLRIGGADLFGPPSVRAKAYPLVATVNGMSADWLAYDATDVRTLIATGDSCPDRGVAYQAITLGKGWDWTLDGGTARYLGTKMDTRYSGPDGRGWPVVIAKRVGDRGRVAALIADADLTIGHSGCPMVKDYVLHEQGTVFSVDPKVASLLARHGYDVVTLGSNHSSDRGAAGLRDSLNLLDKVGIKHVGAGKTLAEALKPAVVDVRGVRFAFVAFNSIAGSTPATASRAGVAWMTTANMKSSLAAARKVGDVVIAMPHWGWPEYHADFTAAQRQQRATMFKAGADHIVGLGNHWAAAVSITPGTRGDRFVISSSGNFLFGQDWSRQTEEGVVVELTFIGTRLVQARLHPYIVLDQAQPNLTNPATDGKYVLHQVWSVSELP